MDPADEIAVLRRQPGPASGSVQGDGDRAHELSGRAGDLDCARQGQVWHELDERWRPGRLDRLQAYLPLLPQILALGAGDRAAGVIRKGQGLLLDQCVPDASCQGAPGRYQEVWPGAQGHQVHDADPGHRAHSSHVEDVLLQQGLW